MKTILLKVEVPDGHELMASSVSAYKVTKGSVVAKYLCRFTEITLPTEEEIIKKSYEARWVYKFAYKDNFTDGAKWLLNKLK